MKTSRRKLLKSITLGGGAVSVSQLPSSWTSPIIDSVVLPSHAATTTPAAAPTRGAAAPDCPGRVLVFQICNENAVIDDNFDIYLNGTKIGAVDLNQNALVGSVFIAHPSATLASADFPCPIGGMTVYRFNPALVRGGGNTIAMKNTQENGRGNYGVIGLRNYELAAGKLSNPCKVQDIVYSPASGADATLNFSYTECCPGDT